MKVLRKLMQEFRLADQKYHLFNKEDSLVVGVSGGPDSMALLTVLSKLKKHYKFSLHVAHVNHGYLPKESARYVRAVKNLALQYELPLYIKKVNIKKLARQSKRSIEDAGRIARYEFFEEVATRTKSTKIVTAHTLDDQAETLLHRILRGSGLRGLSGIPAKRRQGRCRVVRPFLESEKKDILAMLRQCKIRFCVDPSNQSDLFYRNRIRNFLLPTLSKSFNPKIKFALSNLQSACYEIQNYLDSVVPLFYRRCLALNNKSKNTILRVDRLSKLHAAILNEVLLKAIEEQRGDLKKITSTHIAAIRKLLEINRVDGQVYLPANTRVKRTRECLIFISYN